MPVCTDKYSVKIKDFSLSIEAVSQAMLAICMGINMDKVPVNTYSHPIKITIF